MKLRSLLVLFASATVVVGCSQTDAGVTTAVKSKLTADDLVKARDIHVYTNDHIVTLSGTVETAAEEAQALQIARDTKGVTSVVDEINVRAAAEMNAAPTTGSSEPSPITSATDATTTEAPATPDMANSPSTGTLDSAAADADLSAKVKAALIGERTIKGQQIMVEAHDGVVTLSGSVASNAEKAKAAEVAGKVSNVTRVDDKLTVK
jgi:hyperosmotically inducible periplasmic protein